MLKEKLELVEEPPSLLKINYEKKLWYDYKWQIKNRINSFENLHDKFNIRDKISDEQYAVINTFPMAITPYYASLIRKFNKNDPIYAMSVPQIAELINPEFLCNDPLNEEHSTIFPGLVHRYKDRVLLLTTNACAVYCRHCTRKRIVGNVDETIFKNINNFSKILNYIMDHKEIHDVIISGGDPLMLPNSTLEFIIQKLRQIKHIDIIRIGSRIPVTMPMRITNSLIAMLKKYKPIWLNTHFNHPNEITNESINACTKIINAGIPVGNQSVLLKGINDNVDVMLELCQKLVKHCIRPYYLYQCDLVNGVEHFRTPLNTGIEIIKNMRGNISGLAIPTFIVDAPNGLGKIPLLNNNIIKTSNKSTTLVNFTNTYVNYPEPSC
jgi:lysine 2,3-aminomutase